MKPPRELCVMVDLKVLSTHATEYKITTVSQKGVPMPSNENDITRVIAILQYAHQKMCSEKVRENTTA